MSYFYTMLKCGILQTRNTPLPRILSEICIFDVSPDPIGRPFQRVVPCSEETKSYFYVMLRCDILYARNIPLRHILS